MWSFSKISSQETRAQSKLADFFESNRGGNAGDAESLIRESLQNALDAKSKYANGLPVMVRITVGEQSLAETQWMFKLFDEHVKAVRVETKRKFPMEIPREYAFVLIEDFNTTGFDGTFDVDDEVNKGSLVRFWWEEGTSEKLKGGGGSHGVGKVTLSEASNSRVFFAHSCREDADEILFGYCRIGMHKATGKKHREYARFGNTIRAIPGEDSQLHPYSRATANGDSIRYIDKFRSCFNITRDSPGASILIPNIESESLNRETLINAVLDNFYLPIMKGLLSVELVDVEDTSGVILNSESFVKFCKEYRSDDSPYLEKIQLAGFLIKESGFYFSSTEFDFSDDSRAIREETFSKINLAQIREEYIDGKPIKVMFNVRLDPVDTVMENGFFQIVVQKRTNRADDQLFYEVFRGDVRIRDEKSRTTKANAILDVYGAHDEVNPNDLSEFMKYCEDPGHRNWQAAINRRNEPTKYRSVWQKQLVRNAVRDLIKVLEDDDGAKLEDFADDIFFIITHQDAEVPGSVEDEGEVNTPPNDTKNVIPPVPPEIPPSQPMVSITKIKNGVRLKATNHLKGAGLDFDNLPSIVLVICYEMLGCSKAIWRTFSKAEINLEDSLTYARVENGIHIENVSQNKIVFTPQNADFVLDITGFDKNRQLYVNVNSRELAGLILGDADDNG